ncbi:protein IRX15-LIKE-like [Salvia splendens]|uniref:protein IRX15-LIKE-like n=1 Tax=Salvia splendens TaxID=180675 RepID=UPI001C27D048|nr:protein IRX15-LIKE-like [Salvia splendens]
MKTAGKFPVLHPYKSGSCIWMTVVALFLLFTFTFLLSFIAPRDTTAAQSPLPDPISDALLYYASANATPTMSPGEIESVYSVLRGCSAPCNLLVFGLTQESLLWNSLNHLGRTVFVDEYPFSVTRFEKRHPWVEAYDVRFTTKVRDLGSLMEDFKREVDGECRPVQNLLYSDCQLAVNDLPNSIYEVGWDVIVIDGPSGYSPDTPGRMASIFSAGVMARTRGGGGGGGGTHVFVHEMTREVESVCTDLFLCRENLVDTVDLLGHFLLPSINLQSNKFEVALHYLILSS